MSTTFSGWRAFQGSEMQQAPPPAASGLHIFPRYNCASASLPGPREPVSALPRLLPRPARVAQSTRPRAPEGWNVYSALRSTRYRRALPERSPSGWTTAVGTNLASVMTSAPRRWRRFSPIVDRLKPYRFHTFEP